MSEAIESALSLALHNKNSEIEMIHFLWAMITNSGSVLNQAFNKMGVDKSAIELEVKSVVNKLSKVSSVKKEDIKISRSFLSSLERGLGESTKNGDSFLAVDSYILANIGEESFKSVLGKYLDITELKKSLESIRGGKKIDSQTSDDTLEALSKYGIDLTLEASEGKLSPVIGRDEEISRMMQILIRKTKNNPILLGEPGVGKQHWLKDLHRE